MELSYLFVISVIGAISITEVTPHVCRTGQFKLSGMEKCHDWLTCSDLKLLKISERIGSGSVKLVRIATWEGHKVAVSHLISKRFTADFDHGLNMLVKLSPSPYIVQLVGFCKDAHFFVTEYHKLGNATSVVSLVDERYGKDNLIARLKLCLNYAHILEFMHDSPIGTRVMCDSNSLDKLLSQILINDNLQLIVNDLDALPLVDKSAGTKITCGSQELQGDFVAPEQKWPYAGPFRAAAMPGYDEKTDIWKAGDVFRHFLSKIDPTYEWVQYRLFNLFKSCKHNDPALRPTAKYIVSVLEKILAEVLLIKTEL